MSFERGHKICSMKHNSRAVLQSLTFNKIKYSRNAKNHALRAWRCLTRWAFFQFHFKNRKYMKSSHFAWHGRCWMDTFMHKKVGSRCHCPLNCHLTLSCICFSHLHCASNLGRICFLPSKTRPQRCEVFLLFSQSTPASSHHTPAKKNTADKKIHVLCCRLPAAAFLPPCVLLGNRG